MSALKKLLEETKGTLFAPTTKKKEMQTNTPAESKPLALAYGQCQALKVLVANKMGLNPCHVAEAELLLRGGKIHSMEFASIDREGCRAHNTLASSPEKVMQANRIGQTLLVEYELA